MSTEAIETLEKLILGWLLLYCGGDGKKPNYK